MGLPKAHQLDQKVNCNYRTPATSENKMAPGDGLHDFERAFAYCLLRT